MNLLEYIECKLFFIVLCIESCPLIVCVCVRERDKNRTIRMLNVKRAMSHHLPDEKLATRINLGHLPTAIQ